MTFDIKGKTALITGGTAGIGLAVARRFVDNGANVVITGRRDEGAELAASFGARFIRADFAQQDQITALFDQAGAELGKLDIVVNNAGIAVQPTEIAETAMSSFDELMAVNQRAAFQVLKLAPAHIKDGGCIINTASISGSSGEIGTASYAASKASLISLTMSSALELAARQIRVNAISPGPVRTDIWGDVDGEAMSRVILPLARMGEVEDCTGAYHFLASDDARFITGINLVVDGGYSAGYPQQIHAMLMG